MKHQLIYAVALGLAPCSASARPLALVPEEPANYAWFSRDLKLIPIDDKAAGILVSQINRERGENDRLCYLEPFAMDSFVAGNRATQIEIYKALVSFAEEPFKRQFEIEGEAFTAQVAAYEDCFGTTGSIIVIADGRKNLMTVIEPQSEIAFLYPSHDGAFAFSSCLECGDHREVFFDKGRRQFYVENRGD